MGPLVTQGIIAENWNFILAFVIGIGFGFVLEQAGFSSSRKLAGVFYGYDFVVLRVFFTAAITAMTGLIFFHYFGWIDLELIYVNPTFVSSSILGGIIMGLGFIIGGFCPGTSLCAVGIGKIDAMVFFFGLFIGVFIFGEAYGLFEELLFANGLGSIKVFDSLGISQGLFALILIVVALVTFFVTAKIEKKVTPVEY